MKLGILNFDNEYLEQDFYKNLDYDLIDMTDLVGVNGYCDEEASFNIKEKIKNKNYFINFIGNGNFHYISYFLLSKIEQEFTLVLFDHHTDMQSSLFGDILSCGSWVKKSLDENKFLKKVIIIGVNEELFNLVDKQYLNKVSIYSEQDLINKQDFSKILKSEYPVYISIDKDVFSEKEVHTNWDAGSMQFNEFQKICDELKNFEIIGVDICGGNKEYNQENNKINLKILNMFLNT